MGWKGESRRHSLARRGIRTANKPMKAMGSLDKDSRIGMLLTDKEHLWDKISYDRMKELLNDPKIVVLDYSIDYNSYGEFFFITLKHKDDDEKYFTFFGLGLHEGRNRWMDEFTFYTMYKNDYTKYPMPSKAETMISLNDWEGEFKRQRKNYIERYGNKPNRLYEEIADMSDDDFAMSQLDMW